MQSQARIALSRLAERLKDLKLINYYPAAHNWSRMWTAFDPSVMDADYLAGGVRPDFDRAGTCVAR